jgi:16S rRNA processing protein RimM
MTDFPSRLPDLNIVWLSDGSHPPQPVRVKRCWLSRSRGGQAIFHFTGIENREGAEGLRGLEVQVPIERRARLQPGRYYVGDLIGCEVWETGDAVAMGIVRDVEFPGGVPLLNVESSQGEVLVPLATEICLRIDVEAKRIDVSLPEGLRDLNRG